MLSAIIRDIRKKNYLNQTAFANRIGVTQGAVSQWECGLTRPNMDQLKTISLEFGVSIDDLLADEPIKDPLNNSIRTPEAKIIANGIDKLPKDQREQALNVIRAMFAQYFDYFKDGDVDDPRL